MNIKNIHILHSKSTTSEFRKKEMERNTNRTKKIENKKEITKIHHDNNNNNNNNTNERNSHNISLDVTKKMEHITLEKRIHKTIKKEEITSIDNDIDNINDNNESDIIIEQKIKEIESSSNNRLDYDLIICVFCCDTIQKYKDQIIKITETWGKKALDYPNIKVLYFLGSDKTDIKGNNFINLNNVKNDYLSASYKQNLGLKYIKENYNPRFVYVCGTDTYINIPKMMNFIKKYNYNENLYIGGFGETRNIVGIKKDLYFHYGGSGFILTNKSLIKLYYLLGDMTNKWIKLCKQTNNSGIIPACDISISYYLQKPYINVNIIKESNDVMSDCKGYEYFLSQKKTKDLVTAHPFSLDEFDKITKELYKNNYYV